MSKFATVASKLFELVANCSEQTANQNTNIAAEVCKVAWKRTSGLTVTANQRARFLTLKNCLYVREPDLRRTGHCI